MLTFSVSWLTSYVGFTKDSISIRLERGRLGWGWGLLHLKSLLTFPFCGSKIPSTIFLWEPGLTDYIPINRKVEICVQATYQSNCKC